jgi:hypothetical protein
MNYVDDVEVEYFKATLTNSNKRCVRCRTCKCRIEKATNHYIIIVNEFVRGLMAFRSKRYCVDCAKIEMNLTTEKLSQKINTLTRISRNLKLSTSEKKSTKMKFISKNQ